MCEYEWERSTHKQNLLNLNKKKIIKSKDTLLNLNENVLTLNGNKVNEL